MKRLLYILTWLLAGLPSLAAAPPKAALPRSPAPVSSGAPVARALSKEREPPCLPKAPDRKVGPQGTLLWGTTRKVHGDERSSVLASLALGRAQRGGAVLGSVQLKNGRLVIPPLESEALVGAVLQGVASDDQPMEVALCRVEPSPQDAQMVWYQIEIWNAEQEIWENPCIASEQFPSPRALAIPGIWDQSGSHHPSTEKFTFACEGGAIAKCIGWGYKPWATKDGRSLEPLHQACTRMARADYCGDGFSHTHENCLIDMYDSLGVQRRTTQASKDWDPERATFEATWTPEGAWCLSRTRDGQAAQSILEECPDRFEVAAKDFGAGDVCMVRRKGGGAEAALLRNRSYGLGTPASKPGVTP